MKVQVSFELDLTDFPAYNVRNVKDINLSMQNLGGWLYKLNCAYIEVKSMLMAASAFETEQVKRLVSDSAERDILLSEQIFNNYKVEGTTEDGHFFQFTHTEPGYNEKLVIDGEAVKR